MGGASARSGRVLNQQYIFFYTFKIQSEYHFHDSLTCPVIGTSPPAGLEYDYIILVACPAPSCVTVESGHSCSIASVAPKEKDAGTTWAAVHDVERGDDH